MAISEDIQKLYIAYFGRPADPAGLAFYLAKVNQRFNGDTGPVLAEFFDSAEYKSLYNFDITKPEGRQAAVNQVYQNLLNRQADPEGLAFYSAKLAENPSSGLSLLVLNVLDGARNTDVDTIENKLLAASVFTQRLDTQPERDSYNGNQAVIIAREYLTGIDGNTLFQPQENGDVLGTRADQFISRLVSQVGPGAATSNLTFTNLRDTLLGTAGDDSTSANLRYVNGVIDGDNSTLNDGDALDLKGNTAGGVDTLTLNVTGNRLAAANNFGLKLTSVESLVINNQESDPGRNVTFTLNDTDGRLESILLNATRLGPGFDSITTVNGLKQIVDVNFKVNNAASNAGIPNSTPELDAQANTSTRELVLGFDTAAVAGSTDSLGVLIDGTDQVNVLSTQNRNLTPQLTNFKLSGGGIEQLFVENIVNQAAQPPVGGTVPRPIIKSLVLGSTSDVSKIVMVQSDSATFRVDASAVGNKFKEFDGTRVAASGPSNTLVLDIGSSLNSTQLLRGGNSLADVLVLSSPASLNQSTLDSISGFETIRIDTNSTEVLNVKGVRGLRAVELRGSSIGDTFSVNNIQFDSNGAALPEVYITRESSRINGLTASLSTETTGNVGQSLGVGVAADMAKLTIDNPRAVVLTTELPAIQDFTEAVAIRRVIDNLELLDATSLVIDTTRTPGGALELGSITADVLRTIAVTDSGANGNTVLTMNGMVSKSTNAPLDITGGLLADRIFGSNQSDNISGGGGADLINLMDGETAVRDRVIFDNDAGGLTTTFGDTVLNFRPTETAAGAANNDVIVLTRTLVFGNSAPQSAEQVQFGPTTTAGGLLGLGTTTTPDTRIHILGTAGAADTTVDANDVIVIMSNAIRNQLGITASDLEAPGLARLTEVVNNITAAASSNRFILFVSNDVDTFGFQFVETVANDPATPADETTYANRAGGNTPLVKLIGINTASPLDQTDFELIG